MATHTVNGKHTAHGDTVHYTDHMGIKHDAVIELLDTEHHADLTIHKDGKPHKITAVPHSSEGAKHSWNHAATAL